MPYATFLACHLALQCRLNAFIALLLDCSPKVRLRVQPLPKQLLDYCRFAHCIDEESLQRAAEFNDQIVSDDNELTVLQQLIGHLRGRLKRWAGP